MNCLSVQKIPDRSLLVAPLATDKSKSSYALLLPAKLIPSLANPDRTISIRSLYTLKDGRYLAAFADWRVEIVDAKP